MNNVAFGKTMENVKKHRDIKLVTTDKRRNQLVSEPNYHTTKKFSENLLAIEMKKIKLNMNKPVNFGLSILEISKTLTHEFWYGYINESIKIMQNYVTWIPTVSLFILKLKIFMKIQQNDLEKRSDTSNFSKDDKRPLLRGIRKRKLGLMKDKLGGIMMEFVARRQKTFLFNG